ncbi:serine/threonine protein kinase [Tengunoibacter tsumagoiensis]|uniref:non-specific serine/threonine protein kinase n=1 Tax=Tengunoibacter tsumagoiensis TaxID=2014871 RepID=A0A402A4S4_9CHLR|nr:serine/threonine-protein kinase [Tengunoibacter tsumagoiensis]GCE14005.1 protein kinase [Tengunoibacter tsumagoiensis]
MGTPSQFFCTQCGAAHPLHARFCRFCGAPLSSQMSLTQHHTQEPLSGPGSLLKKRYLILSQLGVGGYGEVYKALDQDFGNRAVAVKELTQRGLSSQEIQQASEDFKREAFLLASLTHPNLPSIYDHFTEHGRWYLVMSFIEGETLESYLQRSRMGRLPIEKAIDIGIQLASVLSYLHTRKPPVIFRDLKPSNIMRIPDGQLYLIDFGIARHFKQGKLKDTMALGSPGYAAPEQYGRAQTTPQTDVYSLGAVLHHLLSGQDPTLNPFQHAPLELPGYPALNTLIQCMLEKDAKKRPSSMANIKRELQRMLMGRSHGPLPPPNSSQSLLPLLAAPPQHPGRSFLGRWSRSQKKIIDFNL